jgi:hypothetical protein
MRSENIHLFSPPNVCKNFQYAPSKTFGCTPHKLGRSTAQIGLQLFHSIQVGYGVNPASCLIFTSLCRWTVTYKTKWPKWMEFYRHPCTRLREILLTHRQFYLLFIIDLKFRLNMFRIGVVYVRFICRTIFYVRFICRSVFYVRFISRPIVYVSCICRPVFGLLLQ